MQRCRWFLGAVLLAALMVPACKQIEETSAKYNPATIEAVGETGLSRVTLTAKAVERLGIATAVVGEITRSGVVRKTIPYGAVIYDHAAKAWTYTNPEPLVYIRHAIAIDSIDADVAYLSEGPTVGTKVVTIGAALIFGAEFGVGK